MGRFPIDKIKEVSMGITELPGYCQKIRCISINGYVDFGENGKIIYMDCSIDNEAKGECHFLQAMFDHEYSEGETVVVHKQGKKGDIIDDILEEFEKSDLQEIKIPIIINQTEDDTRPQNMKRKFLTFREMGVYDSELDPETIRKLASDEFIVKYTFTVKKISRDGAPADATKA